MSKKIALIAVFASLAIIISYLERLIVIPLPIPGIKLGLANIVTVILLYKIGSKEAFSVLIIRVLVTGILFGGISSLIYSLTSGAVSFLSMHIAKKTNIFSIIGVSVIGSYTHNTTQILVACIMLLNIKIIYYLPILMITAIFTGILIGFLSHLIIEKLSFTEIR